MAANDQTVLLEDDPFVNVFERFEKLELQELAIHQMTNWGTLLSQECKFSTDPLFGLTESKTECFSGSECFLLVPFDESFPEPYDIRDFHTILRDVTCGIFGFNQAPYITLEPNHDLTSNCSFPPAYLDTLTGKLMVEFDYWIKSLWHGVYMDREARMRVMDKWREIDNEISPENTELLAESAGSGMIDLAKDPAYAEFYSKLPVEHKLDDEMANDRKLFENYLEFISLRMIMMPGSFQHEGNILVCQNIDHFLDIIVRAMDDKLETEDYQRLFVRTSHHRDMINNCLTKKTSWARTLSLLKLVSVVTVLVQAVRNQRSRIPMMSGLFCHLQGEATKTERELPPVVIPKQCAARTFMSSKQSETAGICCHLHGAIGFNMDTGPVTKMDEPMRQDFIDELISEAQRITDLFTTESKRPTQQRYPVPTVKYRGKRYHVLHIRLEEFFPPPNVKPLWLGHLQEDFNKRTKDKDNNQKKLIVADTVMHDVFKRVFGYARAIKCKDDIESTGSNSDVGFLSALQRGLLAIFYTLLKKVQIARLSAQNEEGYALLHMAAIYNRINMAATLISLGMDFNAKRGAYSTANAEESFLAAMKGPTALHLAARAGSLEVVSCLSCLGGEYSNCITSVDQFGWTAVHHAAYFDHVPILLMLLRRLEHAGKPVLELETSDELHHTPLLLSARAGALASMQQLIAFGAARSRYDKKDNGIVELAVLHFHTRILEWLIGQKFPDINVFDSMSKMLHVPSPHRDDPDNITRAAAAARCIDILTSKNTQYWPQLLQSGAVDGLVSWLVLPPDVAEAAAARRKQQRAKLGMSSRTSSASSDRSPSPEHLEDGRAPSSRPHGLSSGLQAKRAIARQAKLQVALTGLISASVSALCNIGAEPTIRRELAQLGAGQKLSELLIVPDTNIQARAATVLGDVCSEPDQQCQLADVAFRNLVPLLYESSEDVLVAAVNALRFLVTGNQINQSRIASYSIEAVQAVVDFLSVSESNSLRGSAAACIAALAAGHADNQTLLLDLNAAPPLVALLKARNVSVAVRAAAAVAAMAADNPRCQQKLFELDAAKPLVRVLKMVFVPLGTTSDDEAEDKGDDKNRTQEISAWSLEVKEQTMTALWALAGHTVAQRRRVAELITLQTLVDLLITESDPLRRHSAFAVAAFCREDRSRQMEVFRCNAVQPILRLIRAFHKVSEETLVLLVEALGSLCYLPAFTANESSQRRLFEEGAFKDLLRLLIANIPPANTQLVRVTILKTLSLMTLSNAELRGILFNSLGFKLEPLLSLVANLVEDPSIRLAACQALTTFAIHNSPLQLRISELGGLRYEVFAPFLNAAGWNERCQAAFQIVLLSRIVSDADQVALTAAGVLVLVQALAIEGDCNLLTSACNLIGTLCHARAGVSDAFISAGVLQPLIYHLMNENSPSDSEANKPPTLGQQALNSMNEEVKGGRNVDPNASLIEEVQQSAAIALSFFTRNRTARRLLLSECRKNPEIHKRLAFMIDCAGFQFDDEFEADYAAIAAQNVLLGRSGSRAESRASRASTSNGQYSTQPRTTADVSPPRPKTAASNKSLPSTPMSAVLRSSLSTGRSKKAGGVTISPTQ